MHSRRRDFTHNLQHTVYSQPWLHQDDVEVQTFGKVSLFPYAISRETRVYSCERMNQHLADAAVMVAMYTKYRWFVRPSQEGRLDLLFAQYACEQTDIARALSERVQRLGGVVVGDPRHVAELTRIPRAPDGCEGSQEMFSRMLEALELILVDAVDSAIAIAAHGDEQSGMLVASQITRTNYRQAWHLAERLAHVPG